jgi:uncharacterized protein (TIGR03437 family)
MIRSWVGRTNSGGAIRRGQRGGVIRRGGAIVAFLLLGASLASAGRVTATYPLPKPATVSALQQDTAGNVYLAGYTGPTQGSSPDFWDAFVAKLSSAGTVLFWTTFGGSKADYVRAMAIAPDGSVSVAGSTDSLDFPLTSDAAQTQFAVTADGSAGFFVRLDVTGKVRYSSYLNTNYAVPPLSGAPQFSPTGITLDAAGDAYINGVGSFTSTPGALPTVPNAGWILKLDASGKMVFGTGYIGGRIGLDSQGFIYVVGANTSDFALPVTPGAFQTAIPPLSGCGGNARFGIPCSHQYVAKLDPTAGKLIYATWISGTNGAVPAAMAVDSAGNVTVAGVTASRDYPVTPGAYQTTNFTTHPPSDTTLVFGGVPYSLPVTGYVTKLNATGSGLVFSTYLGGSSVDSISSMVTDSAGRIYLGGVAESPDLPGLSVVPDACRPSYFYPLAFATRLSADGSSLTETQLAFGLTPGLVALDGQGKATAQMGGSLASLDLFAAPSPLVCTTDAADFAPLNSIAPGQLLSLFGEGIGPTPAIQAQPQGGFIPVSLGYAGLSVTFNDVAAPILYASSGQVNVQVPYEVADLASVTMKIQYGTTSTAVFSVVPSQPSAFVQAAGYAACGYEVRASLLPFALNADGSVSGCGNQAPRGTSVLIFLNGLGLAGGHPITGAIGATSQAPPVSATASFSTEPVAVTADAGAINGVWQAQIAIPLGWSGPSLQFTLTVNGAAVRNSLVLWLK